MSGDTTPTSGKDWAEKLIDCYKMGMSDAEVAAEQQVTIKKYYQTIADNPTFAKLVEYGRTLSLAWWEGQARKNINNKGFNTPLWTFYMKNKHAWADKTEAVTTNENLNTDLDALREKVTREIEKHVKRYSPELTDAQRVLSDVIEAVKDDE